MVTKTYFVDYINNRRYPLNGVIPSGRSLAETAPNNLFQSHIVLNASELPPKVDLRPDMTPIENQSSANSCVGNSLAGAYEYLVNKGTNVHVDVSRLFMYYNARYRANPWGRITDSGCMIHHAIGGLFDYGTCLESLWPYELWRVNMQPSAEAYQSAKDHKIVDWLQLQVRLEEMKLSLAQGYPFTFGVELFDSFSMATQSGQVPMPSAAERDPSRFWDPTRAQQQHRYHAMLAVGYSDRWQMFIVRNSWGEQWGDKGYCYMPYAYLADPSLCFDVWVIRKLATDDFSHERWSFDDNVDLEQGEEVINYTASSTSRSAAIIDVEEPDDDHEAIKETNVQATSSQQ